MANAVAWRQDRRRRSMCATCDHTRADVVHITLNAVDRILTYQCPSCGQTWTIIDPDPQFASLKTIRIT
jgi:transcription elongation factor Elf1